MAEITRAEMQKEHYRAVRENGNYRLDGMLDVLREEVSMQLPYPIPPLSEALSILTPYSDSAEEPRPMRIYLNIDRKSMELQKRIALLEMKVDTLKEIKTHGKKTKEYKY